MNKYVNGVITELSALEIKQLEAQEAAYVADEAERIASDIRTQRERLLSATDWMALSDSPVMSADWATYRQALRDVTAQTGFPYDVNWPTKPE